jgi:kynurenine formamidase
MNFEPWRGPARSRLLHLEEHTGTHFDAPCHFYADDEDDDLDGRPLREISTSDVALDRFVGAAAVIDILPASALPGQSPWVGEEALNSFESTWGALSAGDIVLLRTGWSERYYLPLPGGSGYVADVVAHRAPGWPAPTTGLIDAIASRGVSVIGVDTPSVGAAQDPIPAHRTAFRRGLVLLENLANLSGLPPRGATFMFLPLSIVGGTGSPGRAVAFVPGTRPSNET